jgi:hypothetical protein
MVKFETVRKIALALPETTEKMSYGAPAFFVRGKVFVGLRKDTNTLSIKATELDRRALSALEPDTYAVPPHYENYPGMVVQLATVERKALAGLIVAAWRMVAPKKVREAYDAAHGTIKTSMEKR